MAFSSSSYFAGIGTAFVAIALGFAGGAMITTSAVQPPNRLERVTSSAPLPPAAPPVTTAEQPTTTAAEGSPSPQAPAPSPKADSQPAPNGPVVAKGDTAVKSDTSVKTDTAAKSDSAVNNDAPSTTTPRAATVGLAKPQSAPSAKSDEAAPAKNERTGARTRDWRNSYESRREAYRKRAEERKAAEDRNIDDRQADDRKADDRRGDDRKFTERRRRQDPDDATNAARQPRGDSSPDQVIVERDGSPRYVERDRRPRYVEERTPRYVEEPAPRSGFFGLDEGAPRRRSDGFFGLFGND